MAGKNKALMDAYLSFTGGYFDNLVTSNGPLWGSSNRVLDIMTRPYPRLWGNQTNTTYSGTGWSSSDPVFMAKYLDFVTMNPGGDKQSEMLFARQAHELARNSVRTNESRLIDAVSKLPKPPVLYLPYHGSDSQNGNSTDNDNNLTTQPYNADKGITMPSGSLEQNMYTVTRDAYRLVDGNGNFVYYADYISRPWFGLLYSEFRNIWALNMKRLLQGHYWDANTPSIEHWGNTDFSYLYDGCFCDNAIFTNTLLCINANPANRATSFRKPTRLADGTYSGYTTIDVWNLARQGIDAMYGTALSSSYCGPDIIIIGNSFPYKVKEGLNAGTSPYTQRHFCMCEEQSSGLLALSFGVNTWASVDIISEDIAKCDNTWNSSFAGLDNQNRQKTIEPSVMLPSVSHNFPQTSVNLPTTNPADKSYTSFPIFPWRICAGLMTDSPIGLDTDIGQVAYECSLPKTVNGTTKNWIDWLGKIGYPLGPKTRVSQTAGDTSGYSGLFKREFNRARVYCNTTIDIDLPTDDIPAGEFTDIFGNAISGVITVNGGKRSNTSYRAGGLVLKRVVPRADGSPANPTPNSPTGLTAVMVKDMSTTPATYKINMAWQDNSTNETGFKVSYSTNGGASYSTLASLLPNTVTYQADLGQYPVNAVYTCRVGSYITYPTEVKESYATVTTVTISDAPIAGSRPNAPTNLKLGVPTYAVPYVKEKTVPWSPVNPAKVIQIPMSWTNPTTGSAALGFEIQMKISNMPVDHPSSKWQDIWYSAKDRYTTPIRRFMSDTYDIHWTEYFNTSYTAPYEAPLRD